MTTIAWRKCLHTNILQSIFITSSIGTIALKNDKMEGEKLIMGLKAIVNFPPLRAQL
jgi:hypothetical protein